jgi:hypothetical protein
MLITGAVPETCSYPHSHSFDSFRWSLSALIRIVMEHGTIMMYSADCLLFQLPPTLSSTSAPWSLAWQRRRHSL